MNIVDICLILIIIFSGLVGLKRGFIKEVICFLGFFIIIVLAFVIKNPLSKILYEYLPFFKFGIFKQVTSLNIILYEIISFVIILSVLLIVFRIIVFATTVFEKLLKMTIVLGIPSKILGFFVGIVEGLLWSFILLYILSLPLFNNDFISKSKIRQGILNNTFMLSNISKNTLNASHEFFELKNEYEKSTYMKNQEFDLKVINIFLKYKIVSKDSINVLVKKDKIKIKNIDTIINKYN